MKRFKLVVLAAALAVTTFGLDSRSATASPVSSRRRRRSRFRRTSSRAATITTTGINFANYDPVVDNHTTPLDANGTVTVACTSGAATSIGMDQGMTPKAGSSAAAPLRQMASGANRVRYDLYQDALRSSVWGDLASGTEMAHTSSGMAPVTFTIYGRMGADQDAVAGAYLDTVTASVEFWRHVWKSST